MGLGVFSIRGKGLDWKPTNAAEHDAGNLSVCAMEISKHCSVCVSNARQERAKECRKLLMVGSWHKQSVDSG